MLILSKNIIERKVPEINQTYMRYVELPYIKIMLMLSFFILKSQSTSEENQVKNTKIIHWLKWKFLKNVLK